MKKPPTNITYLFNLTTNFKPQDLEKFNNTNIFINKNKNHNKRIICRNFFLFILLIKYNKNKIFSKSSFFIKPLKRNLQTILRAPYRHKLTRHQLTLIRYNIICKIVLNTKRLIKIKKFKDLLKIVKTLNSYNNWIESNIISNNKIKFYFNFFYKNNFILNNFNKNKNK